MIVAFEWHETSQIWPKYLVENGVAFFEIYSYQKLKSYINYKVDISLATPQSTNYFSHLCTGQIFTCFGLLAVLFMIAFGECLRQKAYRLLRMSLTSCQVKQYENTLTNKQIQDGYQIDKITYANREREQSKCLHVRAKGR